MGISCFGKEQSYQNTEVTLTLLSLFVSLTSHRHGRETSTLCIVALCGAIVVRFLHRPTNFMFANIAGALAKAFGNL
jgi:hypothetical protein